MVGVIVNLKLPKLEWTNEVSVIKQSASVLVAMIIGFISLLIPFGLSFLLSDLNGNLVMLGIGVVILVACGVMYRYIQSTGEFYFGLFKKGHSKSRNWLLGCPFLCKIYFREKSLSSTVALVVLVVLVAH